MNCVQFLVCSWSNGQHRYSAEELRDYAEKLVQQYKNCSHDAVPGAHECQLLAELFEPHPELTGLPEELGSLDLHERYWKFKCRAYCAKLTRRGEECDEKQLEAMASTYFKHLALKNSFPQNPSVWEGMGDTRPANVGLTKEGRFINKSLADYFAARCLVEMAFEPEPSKEFRYFLFEKALNGCVGDERLAVRAFASEMLLKETEECHLKINEEIVKFMDPFGAFELAVYEDHVGIVHFLYCCLKKFLKKFPCGQRHLKMKHYLDEFVVGYRLHTAAQDGHSRTMLMLLDIASAEGMALKPAVVHLLQRQDLNWLAEDPRHLQLVERLLNFGVEKDVDLIGLFHPERADHTLLEEAVSKGNDKLVQLAVNFATCHRLNSNVILLTKTSSLIHRAARIGTERIVDLILSYASGCDVDMLFQPDERGRSPLHYAALNRHENVINKILSWTKEEGIDFARLMSIDEAGRTPLHAAAETGHLRVVQRLVHFALREGFDLVSLLAPDGQGRTPVHIAATMGNDLIVEYLFAKCHEMGVDGSFLLRPNGNGLTALFPAASAGHEKTVRQILKFAVSNESFINSLCSVLANRIVKPADRMKGKRRASKSCCKAEKETELVHAEMWEDGVVRDLLKLLD